MASLRSFEFPSHLHTPSLAKEGGLEPNLIESSQKVVDAARVVLDEDQGSFLGRPVVVEESLP